VIDTGRHRLSIGTISEGRRMTATGWAGQFRAPSERPESTHCCRFPHDQQPEWFDGTTVV
jgi:hypothetical protein